MAKFELVPATEAHARDLAAHFSPQSVRDCEVLQKDPGRLCVDNLRTSVCVFAGLIDGRCFCLFGVTPDFHGAASGQPWLLTSADLPHGKIALARGSRQYLPYLRQRFTWLHGWVYEHNSVSIKWLRWLGYTLAAEPTVIDSRGGRRYYAFEWRSE